MNIDLHGLLLFTIASFVLVIMPGPNTLYVITRGVTQGKRAALISAFGASLGQLLYAVSTALGLVVILQQSATAYSIIKIVGALYILYIGVKTIRSNENIVDHTELPKEELARNLFLKGFITAALNPKTAIFFVSFLPQFVDASSESAALMMLMYGFIYFLLGLLVLVFYARASGFVRHWLVAKPVLERYFRWITGTIFIGLGLKLMVPENK